MFSNQGKPPNNAPSVKIKSSLLGLSNPIQTAGKKGYLVKDRAEWEKALVPLTKYFLNVESLGDMVNPLYK